jgi:hypothetical protein
MQTFGAIGVQVNEFELEFFIVDVEFTFVAGCDPARELNELIAPVA